MSDPKSNGHKPNSKTELLGQVDTPVQISNYMAKCLLERLNGLRVLDPCVGKGVFPEAIIRNNLNGAKIEFTLIDIDNDMVKETIRRMNYYDYKKEVINCDYLLNRMDNMFDGVIFNPPFVRQEWIEQKKQYQMLFKKWYKLNIPGTSNLYTYFIVKSIQDLHPGGTFCCITYDSWQFTRFGKWMTHYLETNCMDLYIEAVKNSPFKQKLIDATIIIGKRIETEIFNDSPSISINSSKIKKIEHVDGYIPLSHVFNIKRGLRLKQANFFLYYDEDAQDIGAIPFLKKVVKVPGYHVPDDLKESALLISEPSQNPKILIKLQNRLEKALREPDSNIPILTWYKERPLTWYIHRKAPYAPLIFNYYLRHRPRHIYNSKHCYSDNFYGLTPIDKNLSLFTYLAILNSSIVCSEIIRRSRNQGAGLLKIQLYEYRECLIPDPNRLNQIEIEKLDELGKRLVQYPNESKSSILEIDSILSKAFSLKLIPTHLT